MSEVRRRLALADRHEQTISADEIVFLADLDVLIVINAVVLEPDRIAGALIALFGGAIFWALAKRGTDHECTKLSLATNHKPWRRHRPSTWPVRCRLGGLPSGRA